MTTTPPAASISEAPVEPSSVLKTLQHNAKVKEAKEAKETKSKAPFAKGTRLRYAGGNRLFANYQMIELITPGTEIVIADSAGAYSMYELEMYGQVYEFAISDKTKSEWLIVAAS